MKTWTYCCLACFLIMMEMAQGYQFIVWQSPELPKGTIEQDGNWFKLSMTKTAGTRNYTIAIGNTPDNNIPMFSLYSYRSFSYSYDGLLPPS